MPIIGIGAFDDGPPAGGVDECPDPGDLVDFVEGKADRDVKDYVDSHLGVCPRCRHEVEDIRVMSTEVVFA